jgi:DNA-binding HxlR family transcriptional regulator
VLRQAPISHSKSPWPSAPADDAGDVEASPDTAVAISMRAERPAIRTRLYGTVMVRLSEWSTAMDKEAPAGNPSRPNPLPGCPMAAAFAAIGGKWKLTLLYWLAHGESHFAGLRRRGTPITPKVLAEQLRELEADGLVERVVTGPVPARVLYRLTPYGTTLLPVVEGMRVWGEAHLRRTRGGAAPDSVMSCTTTVVRAGTAECRASEVG